MISLLLSVVGWLFALLLAGLVIAKVVLLVAILALTGAWRRRRS